MTAMKTNQMQAPEDRLLALIDAHRAGMRAFATMPDSVVGKEEDAAYDRLVGPHSEALKNWAGAATTTQGAIEALKFMIEEDMFNDMAGKPLARAVIAFLEGRETTHA